MNNKNNALLIVVIVMLAALACCGLVGTGYFALKTTDVNLSVNGENFIASSNENTPATLAVPAAPAYVDLCDKQVNPAWANLVAKNTLRKEVYELWLADVTANGGSVFGASKCSLPVDSRIFAPGDTVTGSGPTQLVTSYRFDATWRPEVNVTYKLASGCVFTPLFSQGDAPVAIWVTDNTVTMSNNVSNGVSIIGNVTCGQ